ncbi:MAG: peptidylprolyl isomerase [Bacteroidales bacterium]|nr:peptidylprolyl isomerase [Bacteroidales bacterium]
MALIGKIRKQSGLLIIIVGVALAAFVLGDLLNPRTSRRQIYNIAELYGEDIPITQFNERVEKTLDIQRRNQQTDRLSEEDVFRTKEQVWKQIVQEIIMGREFEELNLHVTPDELYELVQGEDPHSYILQYFKDPETDQYNPQLVRNYLKNYDQMTPEAREQWNNFEKAIKDDRLQTKYKNLITKAYFMPDTLLYGDFMERRVTADIRLAGYRYISLPDSLVEVTDRDFNKYYDEYGMNYKQTASRDLNFVIFEVYPTNEDRSKIREEVFRIYDEFLTSENIPMFVNAVSDVRYDSSWHKKGSLAVQIDSLMFNSEIGTCVEPYIDSEKWYMARLMDIQNRPDSMKASHVLISFTGAFGSGEDMTRTREEAEHIADSIMDILKSDPSRMEYLAAALSDDPSAAENKGDLGWFADGSMVYPFNQAVLENKVGDIVKTESQFGWHIIKVTDKKEPEKKVRVALVERAILPSNQSYQEVYTQASRFAAEALTAEAFDTLANNMGLSIRNANYLAPMGNRIAGFENARPVVQWSHMENVGEGSISPVFTLEDKFVVAMVTKVREEGIPPMEDLLEVMRPLIIKEKKGDVAVEKVRQALAESNDLYRIAEILESKVDTVRSVNLQTRNIGSYGNEVKLVAAVFSSEEGVLSGPVKGENSAFVFIADMFSRPDLIVNYRTYEQQLINNFTSKVNNNSYLTVLEEEADITDNRVMFY